MTALLTPASRWTIRRRAVALLCAVVVVGVPVVHALTEVVGSARSIEAKHTRSCQTMHAPEYCNAAAAVLIARPAATPAARPLPPATRDPRGTAPTAPVSAPLALPAAARAPPAS